MKRIILGNLPSDYNHKKDLVLSDLSFNENESAFNTKTYLFSPEGFQEKMKFSRNVTNLSIYYSDFFAKKYNPEMYKDFSTNFWRRIYFTSMYEIITTIDRYQKSNQNIILDNPKSSFEVSIFKNPSFNEIIKEIDFSQKFDVELQHKILSRIILKAPKKFNYKFIDFKNKDIESINNKNFKEGFIKILDRFFNRSSRGYGIGLFYNIVLSIFLSLKKKRKSKIYSPRIIYNRDFKNEFKHENLLEDLIPQDLKNISEKIQKLKAKKFKSFSIRLVSNKLYRKTNEKIIAYLASEKNEKIISAQHGGYPYGSWKGQYGLLNFIEYNCDYFISWGDTPKHTRENKNIIRLPSPFLSKFINKHSKKNNKIILVGTLREKIFFRYEYDFTKSMKVDYFLKKKDLIKSFDENFTLNNFFYKPYPFYTPYGYQDKKYYSSIFPKLKILDNSLHSEMLKCKLLIIDHPGTTLNIAMISNTPFLLYWSNIEYDFTKKMENYLTEFKTLNIFHSNKDSLIKHLNDFRSNSDLMKWWNSDLIQGLRIRWCNEYAKADKFWILKWFKALYHH